jgi:SAM-dependent methyltransferase
MSGAMPGQREVPPCPVCRGRCFRKLFVKQGRDFWRCGDCGLQRQFPLPAPEELGAYYNASYRNDTYKHFVEATEIKRLTAARRLREILPSCRRGRWLDVGCANGVFVEYLLRNGLGGEGIDLSEVAVEDARQRGLPVVCATLDDYDPGYRYDTVTGFDVLEHVLDPAAFVSSVRRLLVDGGTVALSLPNLRSVARALMRRRWYFYVPGEHLHYFNPSTIRQLLRREGFDVICCRPTSKPMTLDYSLLQLENRNPLVHAILGAFSRVLPKRIREMAVPLRMGEMIVIAKRRE